MSAIFTTGSNAISISARDLVASALLEIGVLSAGETPSAEDSAWSLQKLQRQIDQWNARRELIFSVGFQLFTMKANHSPHTIGPGGDFDIPLRPTAIVGWNFILNGASANPVDVPAHIRDDQWWQDNPLKSLASTISTDLYYSPDVPLGNCYFFPICQQANPVRLQIWSSLQQAVTLDTKLGFVQGYWDAVVCDLTVRLCPSFNKPVSSDLREQWNRAMRIIEANNDGPPRINTNGGGMPASHGNNDCRPDFNFLTGLRE